MHSPQSIKYKSVLKDEYPHGRDSSYTNSQDSKSVSIKAAAFGIGDFLYARTVGY
ncbi:hypothetical protein EZS27_031372 [termite gut metagenome]|uniref:Uncharacterized protein n=1 Tax=termite gut metagenome TaxID=433724 RepID=A0A5J4QCG4_9ZZZZ